MKIIIYTLVLFAAWCPFRVCASPIMIPPGSKISVEDAKAAKIWMMKFAAEHGETFAMAIARDKAAEDATYYHSVGQDDNALLAKSVHSAAVSNALAELNRLRHPPLQTRRDADLPFTTQWHHEVRRARLLHNELFESGAIPILRNGSEWMDGMVLATNGFVVSKDMHEVLISLNWFEQNDNPFHLPVYGANAAPAAMSDNIDRCRRYIYNNDRGIRFDRRFNLWRINEKFEFDDEGNLATKFDVNGNIISKRNAADEGGAAPK